MIVRFVCILTLVSIEVTKLQANPVPKAIEFLILHNNDMHARFEQTSINSGKCSREDENTNNCYGGFARTAHEIRKFRGDAKEGGPPILYLNAGDTYSGTPWYTVFKDNITAEFLNKLSPDAISLGNHEFDDGVAGLVPFLNEVKFPVLATNLDLSKEPAMASAKNLHRSTILNVSDIPIGVIGYVTPETKLLTLANNVEFLDEVDAINKEAKKLKDKGVNIIIALGHSGYQRDQEIAAQCPDVDIVIGGHTNTFLYNGKQPSIERPEGPYPTMVVNAGGRKVPVVQAYAYTKYLGRLYVQFDENGNLISYDGEPILLNAEIPRDSDILELLNRYRPKIDALEKNVIGYTKVHLDGHSTSCRVSECNMGNLIADSMVYARTLEDYSGKYWTDAPIAVLQGGGIRSSIEKRSDGAITENDIVTTLPFKNDLYVVRVTGKTIRRAFERSAEVYDKDSNGGFLQVSGLRVVYDAKKPVGNRVHSIETLCSECDVPSYSKLNDSGIYTIILPDFLLKGGDGHKFKPVDGSSQRLPLTDSATLAAYIKDRHVVYPGLEGRISWLDDGIEETDNGPGSASHLRNSIALLIAVVLLT